MKRKILLPLIMCGLLFSCNGKNNKEDTNNSQNQEYVWQEDEQGLAFYPLDDGTYGVGIGNALYLSNVVIPSTFKGKKVTKVINGGFGANEVIASKPLIKKLVLSDTIEEIGEYAIRLDLLESITLSKNLKKIGYYGLNGDPKLKEIKYNGTCEEFNKIEFAKRWLATEDGLMEEKPSFIFTDKTILYDDLFDHLAVGSSIENVYEKVEIQAHNVDRPVELRCFLETSLFGNLLRPVNDVSMSIEDVGIAAEYSYNDPPSSYSLFYVVGAHKVGTTNLIFTYGDFELALPFIATPDIKITVAEAVGKIAECYKYSYADPTYYCIEGYATNVTFVSSYGYIVYNIRIKDTVDSETYIDLGCPFNSEVTEMSKVRLNGLRIRPTDGFHFEPYYYSEVLEIAS